MEVNSNPMLSVILISPSGNAASMEAALLSLSGQVYRPCEVVLVVPKQAGGEKEVLYAGLIARWKPVFSSFTLTQNGGSEIENGSWYAAGLRQTTGQYLSFMEDSQRIYPYAYTSLIDYLQHHQEASWAFANIGFSEVNEHHQVVSRIDPDPTHDYVGVDYLEQGAISPPGLVIDRTKLPDLIDLEMILAQTSIAEVIALLTLEAKPGHVPMLAGEIRRVQVQNNVQDAIYISNEKNKSVLPWWLNEFQAQKAAQALLSKPILDPTLHQTLVDEQSIYYRQLYMTYRQSTCGKIVRVLLRNYAPAKEMHDQIAQLPKTEVEAIDKILLLQSHPLWELTAPVRWFGKARSALK